MASYHLSAQPVKRSEGRSVVAMAAYRAGGKLADERRGTVIDFTRKRGVAHAEVMVPHGAAEWLKDRETLWNYVERIEKRRDAQLAREINMALPHELDAAGRLALVRRFVGEQFVARGMVADVAIHEPVPARGDDPRNFHAHILLTLRSARRDGLARVKTREWNSDAMLVAWRQAWAEYQNEALRQAGRGERVDHRSLLARKREAVEAHRWSEVRVLDREPEVHVGAKARKAVWREQVRKDARPLPREALWQVMSVESRSDLNVRRLAYNARKAERAMVRTEVRLARLRARLGRYERVLLANQTASKTVDRRLDGSRVVLGIKTALNGLLLMRHGHVVRRREQVLWLIDQLELVFRALLGFRESQLVRQTEWRNRLARWRRERMNALLPGDEDLQRGSYWALQRS